MARPATHDILFEPVNIGPLVAKNRFYQVPHCNGMGHLRPASLASMREVKAEGGWAVVCTEEVDIHHTSDLSPYAEGRLWDDADIAYHAATADAIHRHGALAAIELVHQGMACANRYSRSVGLGPSCLPVTRFDPVSCREMTKSDIANLRRWHRNAALRARQAGYDIIYVYAGHNLSVAQHFLVSRYNHRTDEYGGSLENRARLLREMLEETKDAVGTDCAVALRFAVDELMGEAGLQWQHEGREVVELLAELPDLWDVNISNWRNDSQTARFAAEGYQEEYTAFVKEVTSKPVVGVGRFTSPDTMASQVRRGVLDFIGAARPSIADPFLPKKVEQGRSDEIRECIGCNICVSSDFQIVPVRCTQNPTIGEEWRRGWHPERIAPSHASEHVLVVGAGPAGLEAALALGKRGYEVTVAERSRQPGGRLTHERRLPGLQTWGRVVDYRVGGLRRLPNVRLVLDSDVDAADIDELSPDRIVLATGSYWRADGVGRQHGQPLSLECPVLTPDDLFAGAAIARGPVVVFDDDHYYMGGVLAQTLAQDGHEVTLVTAAPRVSAWTYHTMEIDRITAQLMKLGVSLRTKTGVLSASSDEIALQCLYTGQRDKLPCGTLIAVTARVPQLPSWAGKAVAGSTSRIGDCDAPGTIAAAVYAGQRYAQELGAEPDIDRTPFRRQRPQ